MRLISDAAVNLPPSRRRAVLFRCPACRTSDRITIADTEQLVPGGGKIRLKKRGAKRAHDTVPCRRCHGAPRIDDEFTHTRYRQLTLEIGRLHCAITEGRREAEQAGGEAKRIFRRHFPLPDPAPLRSKAAVKPTHLRLVVGARPSKS